MSKKEFKNVPAQESYLTLYKAVESIMSHTSAPDGDENPRKKFEELFDFDLMQMKPDAQEKVQSIFAEKVVSLNPGYSVDSKEISPYVENSIKCFVENIKRRCENGIITWEEFKRHLHNVDLQNSPFGIRFQNLGKVYTEIYFNFLQDEGEVIKLYKAEWNNSDSEDKATIDKASYIIIPSKGIEEIWIGSADLMYQSGLREAHIAYNNGESVSFRFSEEN